MRTNPAFLPESLRPVPKSKTHHRGSKSLVITLVLLVIAMLGSGLFFWRIEEFKITTCPGLPPCALKNLESFRGTQILILDLDTLRRQIDCWPGVRRCEISLQLPGVVKIRAEAAPIDASIRTGLGWHALSPGGEIGRRIETPILPILEGFPLETSEMSRGLSAAQRIAEGLHGRVEHLRWITPEDLELRLRLKTSDSVIRLRVNPNGGPAEQWFFSHFGNQIHAVWADLRRADRIVVRERS